VKEKPLLRLAAPVVLSFWMRAAFSLVDTVFASTLGDAAVAAIGLTVPLEFLMIACWVGISTGLTSNLSRAMGAHRGEQILSLIAATRKIVFALSGLFALLAAAVWFAAPKLGLSAEVAHHFQIYACVTLLGSAAGSFWSILPDSVVKAHHDTDATMWAGIWSNLINVALNALFLFYFQWGIFGIAFSTVLGRYGGLLYAIRKARMHERARIATGRDDVMGSDPRPVRQILALALPAMLAYGLMAVEGSALNGLLSLAPRATEGIAAYAVFHRAFLFMAMPFIAITIAMLPFVARLHGQQRLDEIRAGVWEAFVASGAYVLLLVTPACLIGASWVAARLSDNQTTIELITFSLRFCPVICLASLPFILCRPVFEGLGNGRPVALMAVLRYLVLTLPLCYGGLLMARSGGYPAFHGMVAGLTMATALVSVLSLIWLQRVLRGKGC